MTSAPIVHHSNPFLTLNYEPVLESLSGDYFDQVAAVEFPQHILRFRNDLLLPKLGLDPQTVTDADFIEAFGKFQGRHPLLALRYHGYQFGEYNPFLGDGRGFLYGQVRGIDRGLYDFDTKGSQVLSNLLPQMDSVAKLLAESNPKTVLLRPVYRGSLGADR